MASFKIRKPGKRRNGRGRVPARGRDLLNPLYEKVPDGEDADTQDAHVKDGPQRKIERPA